MSCEAFAFATRPAWSKSTVLTTAFIVPSSRRCFVIFRVSTPSIATMRFALR